MYGWQIAAGGIEALDGVFDILRDFFEITEGSPESFAGIQIQHRTNRNKSTIFIHQRRYIKHILIRFGMIDARSVHTPANLHSIASLIRTHNVNDVKFYIAKRLDPLFFLRN